MKKKINNKKILIVFGTRPEAIKMGPLVKYFQNESSYFETEVCVTGQHRQMLDQVLSLFKIIPDYDLNIMKSGQDLTDVTTRVLTGMKEVLSKSKPDLVLVHGDTATSTATALAAFYHQIDVGHVEAGLRTYNVKSPWPEEMNRQITGRLAKFHFAPTDLSKQNLLNELIEEKDILVTGNTVIDALNWVIKELKTKENVEKQVLNEISLKGISNDECKTWENKNRKLVLITGHRRENFGDGFKNICLAIKNLAEKHTEVDFVYPMHLNPNVRKAIKNVFGTINEVHETMPNVYFIEPLDYLPFVYLMNLSYLILTDSGGIQEEAPGLGKPVLVMRDTTERPEALDAGTVLLVGTNTNSIVSNVEDLINNEQNYTKMSTAVNPFGTGDACHKIVEFVKCKLGNN